MCMGAEVPGQLAFGSRHGAVQRQPVLNHFTSQVLVCDVALDGALCELCALDGALYAQNSLLSGKFQAWLLHKTSRSRRTRRKCSPCMALSHVFVKDFVEPLPF